MFLYGRDPCHERINENSVFIARKSSSVLIIDTEQEFAHIVRGSQCIHKKRF